MDRKWMIPLAATLVMLGPGALYAYSLFSQPLIAAFGWTSSQVTWGFALAIFFLGMGAVIGGVLSDRYGPRNVAWAGVLLWGAGNILTGLLAPKGLLYLMLGYGVLGGIGCGMVYVACVSLVIRWYGSRRGFAAGFVTLGFGLGAVVYNAIVRALRDYNQIAQSASAYVNQQAEAFANHAPLASHAFALPLAQTALLLTIFIDSGIAFALFGTMFGVLLKSPAEVTTHEEDLSPGQMLLTPQFYILWVMLFLNVLAGIIVLGNAVPIMQELTNLSAQAVAVWFGVLALFNGIGAVVWGMLSDRFGRKIPYAFVFGIQALAFFLLGSVHEIRSVGFLLAIILFCYGGGFAITAAALADYFGTRWYGANLGVLLTAWGFAGVVGPLFSSAVKELTGSFTSALQPAALMLIIAMIFPLILEPPGADEAALDLQADIVTL